MWSIVDSPPFVRLHGQIVYLKHPPLTPEVTEPRLLEILTDERRGVLDKHFDVDFCYEADHGRYRANVFRQRKGLDGVFRVIPTELPTVESLHLPPIVKKFTEYQFEECGITQGQLEAIKRALVSYLQGALHRRVKYPDQEAPS